jgi:perosamine synthetase
LLIFALEVQGAKTGQAILTCHSFYRNKIVKAEEGGMVTTNEKSLAERMNYLKNMAFNENHDYFHKEIGYNYRMPNIMAELALNSLGRVDKNLHTRNKIANFYDKEFFYFPRMPKRDVVWVYDMIAPTKEIREKIIELVPQARRFFKPCSSFPMYKQNVGIRANEYSEKGFYLPVDPTMSDSELKKLTRIVKGVYLEHRQ